VALRRLRALVAATTLAGLCAAPLLASGGPPISPNYIDPNGGSPGELARVFAGRAPVVMPAARKGMLFMTWRLLHGLPAGEGAGAKLAIPCCDAFASEGGVWTWTGARAQILGPDEEYVYIDTERRGPDYTSVPNCFPEAFERAAATLEARAARYGPRSPGVRAWLATQDGVFKACSDGDAVLPPLPAAAPAWLKADRAYQEAAFALYHGRNPDAAARFAAIARDPASPWRRYGTYLEVRSLHREALRMQDGRSYAAARAAIERLAATIPGTFGRGEADKLLHALEYRQHPLELLARLDGELAARKIGESAAVALHDYLSLAKDVQARPDAADWILTIDAGSMEKATASAHARERWGATKDPAWLIAALAHADAGAPETPALVEAGASVPRSHPGWPTIQYHVLRLSLAEADPAEARARLDAILARPMLSRSERNLFSALRTQVARDRRDFVRFALRAAACPTEYRECFSDPWWRGESTLGWLPGRRAVGFGSDALAIIDRLPLHERIALAWLDWMIAAPGTKPPETELPKFTFYQDSYWGGEGGDGDSADLACLGKCGLGSAPFRTPPFSAGMQDEAAAERAFFLPKPSQEDEQAFTKGATSVWEELLAYSRAHPRDPRSAESLYWLIHIARWGANHDHIGKRAFQLLHRRYPGSYWAKRSPYYYDWPPSPPVS
jgi:hypothetical protein